MKTLQKPLQKTLSTQALNPKKTRNQKPKHLAQLVAQPPLALWDFFLQTREGTQTENLRNLGFETIGHYASLGCHRAKLTLKKFSEFAGRAQPQIQGA